MKQLSNVSIGKMAFFSMIIIRICLYYYPGYVQWQVIYYYITV